MGDTLVDLINGGNQWAAERAQYAIQIRDAVGAGQMSASEAKEVLQDLLNTQVLAEQAAEDQAKAALVYGLTQLIEALA
jgi:polyhydroxyalkanoate synthesis regulator phasin